MLRELIDPTKGAASSAAQAYRALQEAARSRKAKFREADLPTERTILNYFTLWGGRDTAAPWSLADPYERPDFLLETLKVVSEFSEGRIHSLSRATADWIERIIAGVPDIPPGTAFQIAKEYQKCERAGQDTAHLDFALAMRPTAAEAGPLSAPDEQALKERIERHIKLRAAQWADEPLSVWTRTEEIGEIYMSVAKGEGGYMIGWDPREGARFLQLRFE